MFDFERIVRANSVPEAFRGKVVDCLCILEATNSLPSGLIGQKGAPLAKALLPYTKSASCVLKTDKNISIEDLARMVFEEIKQEKDELSTKRKESNERRIRGAITPPVPLAQELVKFSPT